MAMRTVYLIRHGTIKMETDQRCYIGQLDVPLNETGFQQASNLQKRFERAAISAVYCSDLLRTRQTAEIIVANRPLELIARQDLREIHLGEWEGCTFSDIAQRFPNEFKARGVDIGYYCVPGGESFANCSSRVVAAFHEIMANSAGNVLIVAHAGVNRLLLCYMLGMPLANLFRISQDYGCLNIVHCNNSVYHVQLVNFK